MRVAIISDTLGALPDIEEKYDLFVHCGNFCPPMPDGEYASIQSQVAWLHSMFCPWLSSIKAKNKIIIPGHFDLAVSYLEPYFEFHTDAIYLRDQSATIDGMLFYGMSWLPASLRKYAPPKSVFIARNSDIYNESIDRIPDETQVLITRIPPLGILDRQFDINVGDKALLNRIHTLRYLKMHFFGLAAQAEERFLIKDEIVFANGCFSGNGYIELAI